MSDIIASAIAARLNESIITAIERAIGNFGLSGGLAPSVASSAAPVRAAQPGYGGFAAASLPTVRTNAAASAIANRLASVMTKQLEARVEKLLPPEYLDRLASQIVKRLELLDERTLASATISRLASSATGGLYTGHAASALAPRRRNLND
jgi:hypothetical protein